MVVGPVPRPAVVPSFRRALDESRAYWMWISGFNDLEESLAGFYSALASPRKSERSAGVSNKAGRAEIECPRTYLSKGTFSTALRCRLLAG